jgi:O-antigen ligase
MNVSSIFVDPPRRFLSGVHADWKEHYFSAILSIGIIFIFSNGWNAPLFGFKDDATANSLILKVVYYPFYLMGFILVFMRWRMGIEAIWRAGFLTLLLLMSGASYYWSIDPSTTMRRVIALWFTAVCAFGVAARFNWRDLTEILAFCFGVLAFLSLIWIVLIPSQGIDHELHIGAWRGLWKDKNGFGAIMAMGAVSALAASIHVPKRRRFWLGLSLLSVFLVIKSTSGTSLLMVLLGIFSMFVIFIASRGPIIATVVIWGGVSFLLIVGLLLWQDPSLAFKAISKDPTLTGRIFIWEGIDKVMESRPWLGYGYGVVWTDMGFWSPLAWITSIAGFRAFHAHSDWYEVWLALGGVGLALYVFFAFDLMIKALLSSVISSSSYLALPLCAVYFLGSLTESSSLAWNHLQWAILMIMAIKLSVPLRFQAHTASSKNAVPTDIKKAEPQRSLAPLSQIDNRFP